jgi:hypothetical protein
LNRFRIKCRFERDQLTNVNHRVPPSLQKQGARTQRRNVVVRTTLADNVSNGLA